MLLTMLAAASLSVAPQFANANAWTSAVLQSVGAADQGSTRLEIVVDRDGQPVGCAAPQSGASQRVEARGCSLAMHTAFLPARDEAGQAVAGVLHYDINISPARRTAATDMVLTVDRLPSGMTNPLAYAHVILDAAGHVESCTISRSSGNAALDRAACGYVSSNEFAPVHDRAGVAVRAFRSASIGFVTAIPAAD